MKLFILLLIWIGLINCTVNKRQVYIDSTTKRFPYVISQQTGLYSEKSLTSEKLPSLLAGDTIATLFKPKQGEAWSIVEGSGYTGYAYRLSAFAINEKPQNTPVSGFFSHNLTNGFGLGFGFGTERAFQLEALYKLNRHMFRAGYLHQINGQLGPSKSTRFSNYGITTIGNGKYFVAFLGGYDFWVNNRIALGIDGCIGSNSAYQNFSDKRFKAGGYHMNVASIFTYGYGGRVSYQASKLFLLSGGYNTLTGGNLTVSLTTYAF